jgi:hypothetical protein
MLLLWTILLWWRPAISHHSVLLIFRHSLLLRLSNHQISALCQAWTKSKSSWWNSKENNDLTLQKIFWGNSERKSSRPLNPKPDDCVECSIRFGHWRGWGTRCWLCVVYWSLLWRPQLRRVGMMCEIFHMGAHTLWWYGRRFCLWACQG